MKWKLTEDNEIILDYSFMSDVFVKAMNFIFATLKVMGDILVLKVTMTLFCET